VEHQGLNVLISVRLSDACECEVTVLQRAGEQRIRRDVGNSKCHWSSWKPRASMQHQQLVNVLHHAPRLICTRIRAPFTPNAEMFGGRKCPTKAGGDNIVRYTQNIARDRGLSRYFLKSDLSLFQ